MQPYFFPYAGYFSLVSSVDVFVFFDDVQYIRRGWIARNRILNRNSDSGWEYINVPLKKAAQQARICEMEIHHDDQWEEKLIRKVTFRYSKAPFFGAVSELLFDTLRHDLNRISDLNCTSIQEICGYMGIEKTFMRSSALEYNRSLGACEKLIEITRSLGGTTYCNAVGGRNLYDREEFARAGLGLLFVQPGEVTYNQGGGNFVPDLSIMDALMWNSKEDARRLVDAYTVV